MSEITQTKACENCRWLKKDWPPPRFHHLDYCKRYQKYAANARFFGPCDADCKGWEPKPPRIGLLPWFRNLIFGDPRDIGE